MNSRYTIIPPEDDTCPQWGIYDEQTGNVIEWHPTQAAAEAYTPTDRRQYMFIVAYDVHTDTWFRDTGNEEHHFPDGTVWDDNTGTFDKADTGDEPEWIMAAALSQLNNPKHCSSCGDTMTTAAWVEARMINGKRVCWTCTPADTDPLIYDPTGPIPFPKNTTAELPSM